MPKRSPIHNQKPKIRQDSDRRYDLNRNRHDPVRKFRNSVRWINCRKLFKKHHPLCGDPFRSHKKNGHTITSKDVHHIVSLREDISLGLVWGNLAALCKDCHDGIEKLETAGKSTRHLFRGNA